MQYEINKSGRVPTCFPARLDTSEFIDITTAGDTWAKFLDTATGKVHDCADYYDAAMKQLES